VPIGLASRGTEYRFSEAEAAQDIIPVTIRSTECGVSDIYIWTSALVTTVRDHLLVSSQMAVDMFLWDFVKEEERGFCGRTFSIILMLTICLCTMMIIPTSFYRKKRTIGASCGMLFDPFDGLSERFDMDCTDNRTLS
jgi:hypothetical protein